MDEQPTLPVEIRAALASVVQAHLAFLEGQMPLLPEQIAALQSDLATLQL